MKTLLWSAVLLAIGATNGWAVTISGLTGPYDPGAWTITRADCGDGSVTADAAGIQLTGCDDGSGLSGYLDFTATAPVAGVVSFGWSYTTVDGPFFDPAYFVLNGLLAELADIDGAHAQNGSATFLIGAGDVFGFRQATDDNIFGPGVLSIREFRFDESAPVPEPTSIVLLGSGLVGLAACRWRRRPQR